MDFISKPLGTCRVFTDANEPSVIYETLLDAVPRSVSAYAAGIWRRQIRHLWVPCVSRDFTTGTHWACIVPGETKLPFLVSFEGLLMQGRLAASVRVGGRELAPQQPRCRTKSLHVHTRPPVTAPPKVGQVQTISEARQAVETLRFTP